MNYKDAIRFLFGLQMFGANFGLERIRRLAGLAGNPQTGLRFIHVAGTNGKGSVCAMLESVYRAAGLRTGLYTSPHLVHFGERLQVGRQQATEMEVARLAERLRECLKQGAQQGWWLNAEQVGASDTALGHPTFFEVVTVMALIHFAERNCELVLWETGLGGRLDATNIVMPLASVITNVSLEHAAVLGDTITKIAAEKSGVIKPRVPVITGATDPAALAVIRDVAASRSAPLVVASGREPAAEGFFPTGYQRLNAAVAMSVIRTLQRPLPASPAAIEKGLRQFCWPGRLQEFKRGDRRVVVDGAHNPAGLHALRLTLMARPDWRPVCVIFGTFVDKDVSGLLAELEGIAGQVVLVPVSSPRSARPSDLRESLKSVQPAMPVRVANSLREALSFTVAEPMTLITGSLYLAGEAIELLSPEGGAAGADEQGLNDWVARAR